MLALADYLDDLQLNASKQQQINWYSVIADLSPCDFASF